MSPKKSKQFFNNISEDLKIDESIVKDVITYYYNNIRSNLSTLSHPNIKIALLGTFTVKYWLLDAKIEKLSKRIPHIKNEEKLSILKKEINQLLRVKEMVQEETLRKKEQRTIRKEYETNKNLEQ